MRIVRLLVPAAVFATGFACSGDTTSNVSVNSLSGLFFDAGDPAMFSALLSGTVEREHTATLDLSGEVEADPLVDGDPVVTFAAFIDGVEVAQTDVVVDTLFPKDFSFPIDGVYDDCAIDVPCDVEVDISVSGTTSGLVTRVGGTLRISASDVALGEVGVSGVSARLSE